MSTFAGFKLASTSSILPSGDDVAKDLDAMLGLRQYKHKIDNRKKMYTDPKTYLTEYTTALDEIQAAAAKKYKEIRAKLENAVGPQEAHQKALAAAKAEVEALLALMDVDFGDFDMKSFFKDLGKKVV